MKNNKKNKKKGFTLIEILVVVLIIGVLAAIALPSYMRSVERSRAAGPMTNLGSIAKAQKSYRMGTEHYTDNVGNLDISLKDESNGEDATGNTFESEYFTYRVYGDDKAVAIATRKDVSADKQYELSVDYGTNQIYCRPVENKTCIDLGLEEGRDFNPVPQWEECAGQIDDLWRANFGVNDYKENRTSSCQVHVDTENNTTDFEFCVPAGSSFMLFSRVATSGECFKGSFLGDDKMEYCAYRTTNPNHTCMYAFVEKKGENSFIHITRERFDMDNQTFNSTTGVLVHYNFNDGGNGARAICNEFDSNNNCLSYTCQSGDCSIFDN